jgi:hypothetical protein
MPHRSQSGSSARGRSKSKFTRLHQKHTAALAQPTPFTPGITRNMVREHARRLFRDKWPQQPLSPNDWRLSEQDLVRVLEAEAL